MHLEALRGIAALAVVEGHLGLVFGGRMTGVIAVDSGTTLTALRGNSPTSATSWLVNNSGNGTIANAGLIQSRGGTLEINGVVDGAGTELATNTAAIRFDGIVNNNNTVSLGGTASSGTEGSSTRPSLVARGVPIAPACSGSQSRRAS